MKSWCSNLELALCIRWPHAHVHAACRQVKLPSMKLDMANETGHGKSNKITLFIATDLHLIKPNSHNDYLEYKTR